MRGILCNLNLPRKRILLSLALTDIPKDGSSFDFELIRTKNLRLYRHYTSSNPSTCIPQRVLQYEMKLFGPVLDWISLYVDVG